MTEPEPSTHAEMLWYAEQHVDVAAQLLNEVAQTTAEIGIRAERKIALAQAHSTTAVAWAAVAQARMT